MNLKVGDEVVVRNMISAYGWYARCSSYGEKSDRVRALDMLLDAAREKIRKDERR